MFFDRFFGLVSNDMAIDLGTASTLVYVKGQGCIANEPSVVAIRESASGRQIMAVGSEAKKNDRQDTCPHRCNSSYERRRYSRVHNH